MSVSVSPFTVRVPASSANLGPGFDALGVALSLYNRFHFAACEPGEKETVEASGEGAEELAGQTDSLVLSAAHFFAARVNCRLPPLRIHIDSEIPLQRGLGSSATAIVAGIVAADRVLQTHATPDHLLQIAVDIERHPDNVTAALRGGFHVAVCETTGETCPDNVRALAIPVAPELLARLRAVVCIPNVRLGTQAARTVLPAQVPLGDAAFGIGRAALLVAALGANRPELLRTALQDRLHQPYRAPLIPGFDAALASALEAGAWGAALSGSGSTLLALTPDDRSTAVGAAMHAALASAGTSNRWLSLTVDRNGASVR